MFNFLLSYHQVPHHFLDFVFPFGRQVEARDFHFSGLREDFCLDSTHYGTELEELGRSGREIRFSYNLRSVECHESTEKDPRKPPEAQQVLDWSIRQTAIYHSFDVETGRSFWINIKGNSVLEERIKDADEQSSSSCARSRSETFRKSLATHLLFCDWSGENWRWYINDLEEKFEHITRDVLATQVDRDTNPTVNQAPVQFSTIPRPNSVLSLSRMGTNQNPTSPMSRSGTFSSTTPTSPRLSRASTLFSEYTQTPNIGQGGRYKDGTIPENSIPESSGISQQHTFGRVDSKDWRQKLNSLTSHLKMNRAPFWRPSNPETSEKPKEMNPDERTTPDEVPSSPHQNIVQESQKGFSFSDLQRVQWIEEKAQEALLILKLNSDVLEDLRGNYVNAIKHPRFPVELAKQCEGDLAGFYRSVVSVEKDLRMLRSRTENLVKMLENRKTLINGILQYNSVQATQASANNMTVMTEEMHKLAVKTKQETVSMRVITSVTLFFLPATFMATFMSTEFLNFKDGTRSLEIGGLRLYLMITVPMTFFTFVAWALIYHCSTRRRYIGQGQPAENV
ncbi:hypothetical protein BS50DRAFT_634765 [Corynespora cassiicola Philippines]|uniref:CorA-like transporter domain-containing protein n=1 Tax=Corynespora cassiicola Philippines TaxID=1448308 RepID=A0A2T2NPN6_CORCC|nr:hypothetical protein BS50DRAFT_634765 [Corynespora cassiicola Philippines]